VIIAIFVFSTAEFRFKEIKVKKAKDEAASEAGAL
jgi:hypothetical protein